MIATDKTGTLTENRMFVKHVDTPDTARALRAMVLANDAELSTGAGDPLELALLDFAHQHGANIAQMNADNLRHSLLPFAPRYGFNLAVTRSAVFLYESIAQLVFAYPSRRVSVLPMANGWLHLAVLLGVGLQVLTITFPNLRLLLGLEPLGLRVLFWIGGGVLMSWLVAEVFSRFAWARAGINPR